MPPSQRDESDASGIPASGALTRLAPGYVTSDHQGFSGCLIPKANLEHRKVLSLVLA